MASPNSSHVRVFASGTATAALRLACRYLPAASGVPQAKKFDGIPHRRCPPAGSGIAATAGTDHLAATALVGRLNNGGAEHGPLGLNVPRLPRYMVKALPEAQTTVRIRPPTRRRREATLSSTGVNSNIQAPSRGAISIATPARRLSPVATPEWKRVQLLSRRLVPEPLLCVEPRIGPPRSPPSAAAQLALHPTPLAPPAGGEPAGRGSHIIVSGCARPGPMGIGLATRRSPPSPTPRPGSRGGPRSVADNVMMEVPLGSFSNTLVLKTRWAKRGRKSFTSSTVTRTWTNQCKPHKQNRRQDVDVSLGQKRRLCEQEAGGWQLWLELTVEGLMPNLPSPSTRLYSMTENRPESASVALTRKMMVPSSTSSDNGFCKHKQAQPCTRCAQDAATVKSLRLFQSPNGKLGLIPTTYIRCPPSARYLIRGLCEDRIVVVDVHYAHVDGQLRYPGRAAMVLRSDGEIQPLHLLKVHCAEPRKATFVAGGNCYTGAQRRASLAGKGHGRASRHWSHQQRSRTATSEHQPFPDSSAGPAEKRGGSAATTIGNRLLLAGPGSSLQQPRSSHASASQHSSPRPHAAVPCHPGEGGGDTYRGPSKELPPRPSCQASF
ncbi:hypothetical protein N1851_028623 [Merluccius polli]|uniref:Uncharacterized protein n=1 Tax=Merluccius polli TaxID=89951 RepID=A0AA47M8G4_MERPO|nr:hypothetical protein N1851_028623 [Merluccius polli]